MPLLHGSLLHGYKAFLAKLSLKGPLEDASRHQQRRQSKLLKRLRTKALQTRIDPFRAFRRLKVAATRWRERQKTTLALRHVLTKQPRGQLVQNSELQELFGREGLIRTSLILALGGVSKLFMSMGNDTVIRGEEHLHQALHREEGQPLITVSNHVGSIDDPLVIASLVPSSALLQPTNVRWTLCATDRCFKNASLTNFFRAVKVLPVERGGGLHQLGMRAAECRLNQGDWVHIFPEGTRSRTGELLPPRLGIGKLVANCDRMPLVVPFVHTGMQNVMPSGSILPKTGNKIRVLVGAPISFGDVAEMAEERGWTDAELYKAVTDKIGLHMAQLWAELEDRPLPAWAKPHWSMYRHPIVSRDLFCLLPKVHALKLAWSNSESYLRRGHQFFLEYLEYCNMRFHFMRNSFALKPS